MAITLGNTSISGLAAGGLPAGTVNSTTLASASVAIGNMGITGTVIQVAGGGLGSSGGYISQNWSLGGSANTWYDLPTLLNASIVPRYSNSYILIMCNLGNTWNQNGQLYRVWRSAPTDTNISGDQYGNTSGIANAGGAFWQSVPSVGDTNHGDSACWMGYDAPGTTSTVTYRLQTYGEGGSYYLNYAPSDADGQAYGARHTANMILMEIKV
jgi:hypothetical protein